MLLDTDAQAAGSPEESLSRAERRDLQIQRILDAAKACFVRSGFQGASMQQICTEAGMSPGALYRYFPSKEAIIAAIAEADRKHDAEIFRLMEQAPSFFEGMIICGMAHIRRAHADGNAAMFTEIRAESMRNPLIHDTCLQCMRDVENDFRISLRRAIDAREIDPVVSLEALVGVLMSIGEGIAINDLPSQNISFSEIETALRASLTALLRPRDNQIATRT
ncbi:MAG: TetR/AcrR family transcriptional regulator [Methylobacterium mesophilicum]|nr:TetR/AcrR family transcriptional regulator [Methylobacterium mesophilicum]